MKRIISFLFNVMMMFVLITVSIKVGHLFTYSIILRYAAMIISAMLLSLPYMYLAEWFAKKIGVVE